MEGNIENIEKSKPLADQIIDVVRGVNFGKNISVVPVNSEEIFNQLKNGLGLDVRAKLKDEEKTASVLKGLDFDADRVRTQSFAVYDSENDKKEPIGIISFAIAPKWHIEEERYLEKTPNGLILRDYADLLEKTGKPRQLPDFVIEPAWTKVNPKYLGRFALPGFRVIEGIIKLLSEKAPDNTFIEMVAQGMANKEVKQKLEYLISQQRVGEKFPTEDLSVITGPTPFQDLVGKSGKGSESTVKAAKHFKLDEVAGYGSAFSLGPVFIKKIK